MKVHGESREPRIERREDPTTAVPLNYSLERLSTSWAKLSLMLKYYETDLILEDYGKGPSLFLVVGGRIDYPSLSNFSVFSRLSR